MMRRASRNNSVGDDRLECLFANNPHLGWVYQAFNFQLVRTPVIDIRPDIFWVGQNLMDRRPRPGSLHVG